MREKERRARKKKAPQQKQTAAKIPSARTTAYNAQPFHYSLDYIKSPRREMKLRARAKHIVPGIKRPKAFSISRVERIKAPLYET